MVYDPHQYTREKRLVGRITKGRKNSIFNSKFYSDS